MSAEHVGEQLAEHLLGTLEGPEDLEVQRHLRGCASCRREMAALGDGVSTFARAAHEVDPPVELKELVLSVVDREWAEVPAAQPTRARAAAWLVWAAAIVAIAGSVAFGVHEHNRASRYELAAGKYSAFLDALGGENVRVGSLAPNGTQAIQGSAVVYDSKVEQSWVLVLLRAPGMRGKANVVLSSPDGSRIPLHAVTFGPGGEGSTWLVTYASLKAFNRVTVTGASGAALASGTVEHD